MKKNLLSAIALATALTGVASAQYGLLENFEGTDRNGSFVNLSEGINFTYGGMSGGGEGPVLAGVINGSTTGFGWGTGATFSDGFGVQVNAAAGFFDLTQTVNGLTSTGYTIRIANVDDCCGGTAGVDNGDTVEFVIEDDTAGTPGQEIFSITGLLAGVAETRTFVPGTGVAGPNGLANRARFKQFIIRSANMGGSNNTNLNIDNIGFTGNLVPTSYSVENFNAQTIGTAATGGELGNRNVFGGAVTTFAYGAGAVTGASLTGGALTANLNGIEGGIFLNLGPNVGSQADVSARANLSLDLAVDTTGQQVRVILETPDARAYSDRSSVVLSPTTTLATYSIPFTSLVSGAQGFNPTHVSRIAIVPEGVDAGAAGVGITVDNVAFTGAVSASVDNWVVYE